MTTPPIRRYALAVLLAIAPVGLSAQARGPEADPAVLPGDVVRLRVWREGDLTGDFLVDQHFLVTLPLIGELDVRGETELSLRARVRSMMRRELRNPSIQLVVLKRVRVLGGVIEPGILYLDATMSVADALALAGGRTSDASEGKVTLRRNGQVIETDIFEDMRLADLAVQTGDELLVPEKAWLDRNLTPVVTGLTATLGLVIAIFVR